MLKEKEKRCIKVKKRKIDQRECDSKQVGDESKRTDAKFEAKLINFSSKSGASANEISLKLFALGVALAFALGVFGICISSFSRPLLRWCILSSGYNTVFLQCRTKYCHSMRNFVLALCFFLGRANVRRIYK